MRFVPLILLLGFADCRAKVIDSSAHRFRTETVAEGLKHPWALAELPDRRFLVSERGGRLLLFAAASA